VLFHTTNGGQSWNEIEEFPVSIELNQHWSGSINSVSFNSKSDGWVFGSFPETEQGWDSGIMRTLNTGEDWNHVLSCPMTPYLKSSAMNSGEGWAVGFNGNKAVILHYPEECGL
jgi:photosystem II stability/assembly factor-like uncharacterized protein